MSPPEPRAQPDPPPEPDQFGLAAHEAGRDAMWLVASGELDIASAPTLAESLEAALRRAQLIVLDLRRITFMDSSGLHEIVRRHEEAVRSGRRLVVISGPPQVDRLLAITGLNEVLQVADLDSPPLDG